MSDTIKNSLLFFGNEQLSTGYNSSMAPIFEGVIKSGYVVSALILNQKSSKDVANLVVSKIAAKNGIDILTPNSNEELLEIVKRYQPDFGVLAAYGRIISQSVLESFKYDIINIHPSLLPKYRGPTPIEQAMLDGATSTGVSIIRLGAKMDAGDIYVQKEISIKSRESKQNLTLNLSQLGAQLLQDNLESILTDKLQLTTQDESQATYCKLITKVDGLIDTAKSADEIEREVRAYSGWPKSSLKHKGIEIIVLEANVAQVQERRGKGELVYKENKLLLGCKDNSLEITSLQLPGKKPIDAKSFYNGYKKLFE